MGEIFARGFDDRIPTIAIIEIDKVSPRDVAGGS